MKSGALGNGCYASGLFGNRRIACTEPLVLSTRRRSALNVRSVADFVKEKPSVGSNGAGRVHLEVDESSLETDIIRKANYVVGSEEMEPSAAYRATALSVREHLIEAFNKTQKYWKEKDPKFVYYLSAEFLMGRSLTNTVYNLGLQGKYGEALRHLGYSLEDLQEQEQNAALGNGGLGRLAACFLDSIATLDLPGWGYGIRYKYGMFKQGLDKGLQKEMPDIWLQNGNPWEIKRPEIKYKIGFYGTVDNFKWTPEEVVYAQAYDNPVPGYHTDTVGNLRLFEATPVTEFNLSDFNEGAYDKATLESRKANDITAVLYPNDATEYGKELRLKQQIFFVSASIQDVVARFKQGHRNLEDLPSKAVFQMNDTHPTIAVAELMRILIDQEGLDWDRAWGITVKTLAFTNHTVMPEALEKWPVKVMSKLLPRHMEIIDKIDTIWKDSLKDKVLAQLEKEGKPLKKKKKDKKKDNGKTKAKTKAKEEEEEEEEEADPVEAALTKYGIITENPWEKGVKLVNMAFLAVIGSKSTNGVAYIHSEIIKETIFKDFYELYPEKFQNKTNGVTPRRWLAFSNPELASLISQKLGGDHWITHTDELQGLTKFIDDQDFRAKWHQIKQDNKQRLAAKIKEITGVSVPTTSLFDIQIKRIHEYKRQYLNMISIIARYIAIKKASPEERKKFVPRVCVFGGKAASAYYMAKKIVRLVTAVGDVVNNDPDVGDLLKVVFMPDYNVSLAEVIIPAAELSQHISTAGTEASGTSNMKFQMNGCLIIGTNDGANIEIGQEVNKENLFTFGVDAEEVDKLREERKNFKDYDPRWNEAFKLIYDGKFGDKEYFKDLADSVNDMTKGNDWFLVANDFASYMDAQDEVDRVYKDQDEWLRRSIKMTASSGFFSSDRTIRQYAKEIWDVTPCKQE